MVPLVRCRSSWQFTTHPWTGLSSASPWEWQLFEQWSLQFRFFSSFLLQILAPTPQPSHYLDTCFAGLENPWVSCGAAKPSAWQSNRAAFTVGLGPASQWARIQGWFLAVFCSFNIESWQYVSWRRLQMTCCTRLALAAQTHPSATALPPSSSAPGNFYRNYLNVEITDKIWFPEKSTSFSIDWLHSSKIF